MKKLSRCLVASLVLISLLSALAGCSNPFKGLDGSQQSDDSSEAGKVSEGGSQQSDDSSEAGKVSEDGSQQSGDSSEAGKVSEDGRSVGETWTVSARLTVSDVSDSFADYNYQHTQLTADTVMTITNGEDCSYSITDADGNNFSTNFSISPSSGAISRSEYNSYGERTNYFYVDISDVGENAYTLGNVIYQYDYDPDGLVQSFVRNGITGGSGTFYDEDAVSKRVVFHVTYAADEFDPNEFPPINAETNAFLDYFLSWPGSQITVAVAEDEDGEKGGLFFYKYDEAGNLVAEYAPYFNRVEEYDAAGNFVSAYLSEHARLDREAPVSSFEGVKLTNMQQMHGIWVLNPTEQANSAAELRKMAENGFALFLDANTGYIALYMEEELLLCEWTQQDDWTVDIYYDFMNDAISQDPAAGDLILSGTYNPDTGVITLQSDAETFEMLRW